MLIYTIVMCVDHLSINQVVARSSRARPTIYLHFQDSKFFGLTGEKYDFDNDIDKRRSL